MDRRSFVRLLGQATACTIIAPHIPQVLTSAAILPPKPQIDLDLVSSPRTVKVAGWVKVSDEMLDDIPCLTAFLQGKGAELSQNDPDWEGKTTIEIAEDHDDFVTGCKTVVFSYMKPA